MVNGCITQKIEHGISCILNHQSEYNHIATWKEGIIIKFDFLFSKKRKIQKDKQNGIGTITEIIGNDFLETSLGKDAEIIIGDQVSIYNMTDERLITSDGKDYGFIELFIATAEVLIVCENSSYIRIAEKTESILKIKENKTLVRKRIK